MGVRRSTYGDAEMGSAPALVRQRLHGAVAVVKAHRRRRDAVGGRAVEHRRTWKWIGVGALLSVLMRLRMFWSPVTVDEGGYLAIARAWAHGKVLYRDVWVDRPQGLLVLFRTWDWLSGGSTSSIRIMAMLFGVVLVAATAVTVRELFSDVAARWAAIICGVVSASPVLEGHTANGELLSGAMSAAGLAVAAIGLSKPRPLRWFFGSGVLAGVALSLKQSGFDGLLALGAWLFVGAIAMPRTRRTALRYLGALAAGLSSVLAVLMIHGALTGWSRWWTAVAGYRLRVQSGFASAEWSNLVRTFPFAAAVLGAGAVAAVAGAACVIGGARRRSSTRLPARSLLLVVWVFTAAAAFFIGGGYWRHYWLLLAAPISALASVALSRIHKLTPIVLTAIVAPCLAISMWVFVASSQTINVRATDDRRSPIDQLVGQWFISHRHSGDNMYVMCSSAAVYADAHQDPGYPYLWNTEVHQGPNSQRLLVAYLLDTRRAPRYIAQYQSPSSCDSSGRVKRIMRREYHRITTVAYVGIFERNVRTLGAVDRPSNGRLRGAIRSVS